MNDFSLHGCALIYLDLKSQQPLVQFFFLSDTMLLSVTQMTLSRNQSILCQTMTQTLKYIQYADYSWRNCIYFTAEV